ncbi:chemotaxis protein CheW [Telluria mixta]|uniref:Chemotaxis protein CheW n=1 Tax=Telluria mixta TaxID=34071 RepID=A0ABT2BZ31_9BURK|nr:chemotaxis protein CheW [Telluria mixta]MCS0630402.1 chemotaxis protein CheW [Telluria mixta]WEM94294.1 chemotaxis protein CheW [Telluria mixta]
MTAAFDWEALSRRLEAAGAGLAALDRFDPTAQERLLAERAAALAAAGAAPEPAAPTGIEVLAFRCGGERYAFDSAWVARVLPALPLTALPGVPGVVAGIAMWEGEVLAVVDLRVLLALPLTELAEPGALIVLRGEANRFAVLADAIDGTRHFPHEHLGHDQPLLAGQDASWLLGVAPDRTALLDARRLLADAALTVNTDHQ